MGELIVLTLIFGGGIVIAALFLLVATFLSKGLWGRIFLSIMAIISLVVQGGCWRIAGNIGRATGGGSGEMLFPSIFYESVFVAIVWIGVILVTADGQKDKNNKDRY